MRLKTWLIVAALAALSISAGAETIHLKNGKSVEGRILSREADRIWLDTEAGRIPILLDRIVVATSGMLPEAHEAFDAGENERALALAQIIVFWDPENDEANHLIKLSKNQITLAHKGRELTEREQEAELMFRTLSTRLENIEVSDMDPSGEETELLEVESELKEAALKYTDTSHGEPFEALLEEASTRTLDAHRRKLESDALHQAELDLEAQRMRAEAIGIRDFFAPVATLNNGGKPLDIDLLMVPGGIMMFDFYADWCGPCKVLDPKLRSIAEAEENVYLRRINILDWEKPIARQYDLRSIPSVWVYDGEGALVGSKLNRFESIEEAVRRAGEP